MLNPSAHSCNEVEAHPVEDQPLKAKDVMKHCHSYKGADVARSVIQLTLTLTLFAGVCIAMFFALKVSLILTGLFALIGGGLLTRIFILQHDCGHRSFFKSKRMNDWTGRALSLLTATPYDFWRRSHNVHHAVSGDLTRRGLGGIDTITTREYLALPKDKQFKYRLYRNPFLMLVIGTPFYMILAQRFPFNQSLNFYEGYKTLPFSSIWKSVFMTDIALLVFYGGLSLLFGFYNVLAIMLPILIVASWIGGWLFYIQHQFEDSYWEEHENWNIQEAALTGSSYYELPKILQWFSGNIGFHHIHHLCNQIPNYKLQECMDAKPELKEINRLTLRQSLDCLRLRLWDEKTSKMVGFDVLKAQKA